MDQFPVSVQFSAWCQSKSLDVKDHQQEGIEWVLNRERNPTLGSAGGFLCDEMGLGKTILMIGAMVLNPKAHNLVVLPKSLLDQWLDAVCRFSALDSEDILVYHGASGRAASAEDIADYRVVITTYGMIATRKAKGGRPAYRCPLWAQQWDRIIYDEAHHLRNHSTGQFHGAANLHAPIKWMVTGTPINNRKADFYNQCLIQGSGAHFTPQMAAIRRIIDAIVLKRTKKQVGIKMPNLSEEIIEVKNSDKIFEIPWVANGHPELKTKNGYPINDMPWGTLTGIDLDLGEIKWQVPLGTYPELEKQGLSPTGTFNMGGPIVTAGGLIFIGATMDERFRAFDKKDGRLMWEYQLEAGGYATPSTFQVNGKQFVIIAGGGSGKPGTKGGNKLYCFGL